MATKAADQEFLEYVVKALVDHPEEVQTTRTIDEMGVLLTLKVNPKDMGRVIGRAGSTIKAIRALTRLVGLRHNARVNLKLAEPQGTGQKTSSPVDQVVEDLNL